MADWEGNRGALEEIIGAAMPLHPPHLRPNRPAADVVEPLDVIEVATASIATPQLQEWTGYGLRLDVTGTTPGAAVRVAFGTGKENAVILNPGDSVRVARGFERIYLMSAGAA